MSIDQIISRYFSSKATKVELEQLEQWKEEATDNAEALNEMQDLWKVADSLKDYQEFDSSKAWSKLNTKIIDADLKAPSVQNVSIIRRMLPYAASMILVIGAAFYLKDVEFRASEIQEYTAQEILSEFKLDDNSQISLDKHSSLTLVSDFKTERVVQANGRMLFDIASDENRPFIVKTYHGDIKVTGTVFSVSTNIDKTNIYLKEGSIQYLVGNRTIDMSPSDGLTIEKNGAMTKYRVSDPNILSWANEELVFDDQFVSDIFKSLSSHFGKKIDITDSGVEKSCKVSTKFSELTLDQILEELSQILDLKYTISKDQVVVQHLSC